MKNSKFIAITTLLLIISIGNYFRIVSDGTIRTVEFLSILVIGVFAGLLISQLLVGFKEKNKSNHRVM